jgi:hypothetical protein
VVRIENLIKGSDWRNKMSVQVYEMRSKSRLILHVEELICFLRAVSVPVGGFSTTLHV